MGREIRKVPPNWEHPKNKRGELQPMFEETYADARQVWLDGLAAHKPEEHDGLDYWEWDGIPPTREYYRTYKAADATWFQVWETVSEGTPVSPPFATKDELAEYLTKHGDYWDQKRGHGGWSWSEDDKTEMEYLHGIAWNEWIATPEGRRCSNVGILLDHTKGHDVFLRHRLRTAFIAGALSSETPDSELPRTAVLDPSGPRG